MYFYVCMILCCPINHNYLKSNVCISVHLNYTDVPEHSLWLYSGIFNKMITGIQHLIEEEDYFSFNNIFFNQYS